MATLLGNLKNRFLSRKKPFLARFCRVMKVKNFPPDCPQYN